MISRGLRSTWLLLLGGLLPAIPAIAAPGPGPRDGDLRRLFPMKALVTPVKDGLNKTPLPAEILAACRPGLTDLRLVTETGDEVPFAVVAAPAPKGGKGAVTRRRARVEEVRRHEERPPTGPPVFHETYVLSIPDLPDGAGQWLLELSTRRTSFVSHLVLVALDGGRSPIGMLEKTTAFRLQDPRVQRLSFPVPLRKAGRLELRLWGENGGYLEPLFALKALPAPAATQPLAIALDDAIVSRRRGTTIVELPRAPGIVASALKISTSSRDFLRKVVIWDERSDGASVRLGSGTVFRLELGSATVEQLEITMAPPSGPRLRLEIEDGESPPLEGISVTALLPRPVLVASMSVRRPPALYFGGARVRAPRYGIAGLLRRLPGGISSRLAGMPEASLGPLTPNATFDPSPILAFLMHPGAPVDPTPFRHRRHLEVEPSREGLAALQLAPEDLAVLRPDLVDLRVVDGDGRQWAYLLAGQRTTLAVEAAHHRQAASGSVSRYELDLPATPLPVSGLTVDFAAPFFDRPYRLLARTAKGRSSTVRSGRLSRRRGNASPVHIDFQNLRASGLVLEVEDGGDAPLRMLSAHLDVPGPRLFLPAPAGPYTLLLGNPGATPARYELEAVRATILAVAAGTVRPGPLEANPDFSVRSRLMAGGSPAQLLLWIALALAVLVLVWLTLRLARQAPEE